MTTKDIDTFLLAQQRARLGQLYFVLALAGLMAGALIVTLIDGSQGIVSQLIFCGLGVIFGSYLHEGRWSVPRARILEIIENEINRDPEALKYLAGVRAAPEAVQPDRA